MRLIDADDLTRKIEKSYLTKGEKRLFIVKVRHMSTIERPQGEPIIRCKDCKYQVKEWREDKRMKEKGYWAYGCKHFGEIIGYWGFGGNDNEFCSDAEQKGGAI